MEKSTGPIKVTKPTPPPPPPASQQPIQSIKQTDSKVAPDALSGTRQETRVTMTFVFYIAFSFKYMQKFRLLSQEILNIVHAWKKLVQEHQFLHAPSSA